MIWLHKEEGRLVKAWDSAQDKTKAANSMALAPQGTFWITTKVGELDPKMAAAIPADSFAEIIVQNIINKGLTHLDFNQVADRIEENWSFLTSQDDHGDLEPIEIVLVQNRVEGLEEVERTTDTPKEKVLEPAF